MYLSNQQLEQLADFLDDEILDTRQSMDIPDNYYAILGVPLDADNDTLKRVYRQLARRYHPDLAGPEGALEMKRINRAYDVLSDPEKRLNYDTIVGGNL